MYFLYCIKSEAGYTDGMTKMGRPKKLKAERKSCLIPIRVSADEKKAIDACAEAAGVSRSDWARTLLIEASKSNTITEGVGVEPHRRDSAAS
jgi:hypothetical protein